MGNTVMNAQQILAEIEPLGTESYHRVLRNHGVTGPLFGVKIADLKKFEKRFRKDYQLALELFDTGVYDAMYLAGLIADEARMTKEDLRRWLHRPGNDVVAEYAVAWVAADGPHGWDLALEWIESTEEKVAVVGWGTLSAHVGVKPDSELDIPKLRDLLHRVERSLHSAPDRVRYKMNGFVMALGCSVVELHADALAVAEALGAVEVDMGNTSCQVPYAPDYIRKVVARGGVGKKRKSARC